MSNSTQPHDSGHTPQATPQEPVAVPPPGYETRDADVVKVVIVGLGLLVLSVSALVFVYLLVLWRTGTYADWTRSSDLRPAGSFEDVLPSNQELMRKEQEAVEREMLHSYGWIDQDRRIVRIPIERAMQIVGQRGQLPSFPPEEVAPTAPTQEPASGAPPADERDAVAPAAAPVLDAAPTDAPTDTPADSPADTTGETNLDAPADEVRDADPAQEPAGETPPADGSGAEPDPSNDADDATREADAGDSAEVEEQQ